MCPSRLATLSSVRSSSVSCYLSAIYYGLGLGDVLFGSGSQNRPTTNSHCGLGTSLQVLLILRSFQIIAQIETSFFFFTLPVLHILLIGQTQP